MISRLGKILLLTLISLALALPVESAVLNLTVKDTDGTPMAGIVFQIFSGQAHVDDSPAPIKLGSPESDKRDNDGDGQIDEAGEEFAGYATDKDGKLQLELADGPYTLVGFSQKQHILFLQEVSVPGSFVVSAADTIPVSISCRAADGSPIMTAEIFFRPTKQARASLGYANSNGLLNARVSPGKYHAVLWSAAGAGPHYLILPYREIKQPAVQVNFHVAEFPTGEVQFDLPTGTAIAIFEVLESTYSREYAEGTEPEIGYDAAYTDFYPFINAGHPFTLSAGIDYNFNMSFAVIFGTWTIYAYEIRPSIHSIEPGTVRTGVIQNDKFIFQINTERGDKNPVYHPGENVVVNYQLLDSRGNMLSRILNFSEARLIFPMVTIWDPHGVPIANNFGTVDFFSYGFDLPLSAALGEYRVEVTLDAGIYGRIEEDFTFQVSPDIDTEPPQIVLLDMPEVFEAGQDLRIQATIKDNVGLAGNPKLRISFDDGASWTEFPMASVGEDIYQAITKPADLAIGDLKWQVMAQDLAGNRVEESGVTHIHDTSPPVINHEPLQTAELGRELLVNAEISDNVKIAEATLFYRTTGGTVTSKQMSGTGGIYSASIPATEITFDGVSYYLHAADTMGNAVSLPANNVAVRDTSAPAIFHKPVNVGMANTPLTIEAVITDNSGIVEATLFYKGNQDQDYESLSMYNTGNAYAAEIPAEAVAPDILLYHISATDGEDSEGKTRSSSDPSDGVDYEVEVRSDAYGDLAYIEISPSASQNAPLQVSVGGVIRFRVTGRGKSNELIPVDVTWSVTGGIGHIDQSGEFLSSGYITGDGVGRIVATARQTDASGSLLQSEAWVIISPGQPARILLNPGSISTKAGDGQQFLATVTDAYGNLLTDHDEIDWKVESDENIGTAEDGFFTGAKTGTGRVVAELNGINASSDVSVTPGRLGRIEISASKPEVIEGNRERILAGETVQFRAEGYDAFGNGIYISPIWSVRGGIGEISGNGLFKGGIAGSGQIVAAVGDISRTANIEVAPGSLNSISVSPYVTYLPVSTEDYASTQQFVADGWDTARNPVPMQSVSWTTDALAGSISGTGLFKAIVDTGVRLGEIVTNGTIWANGRTAKGSTATGTAYVVIQKSPASSLSSISVFILGASRDQTSVSLATGRTAQFEAVGTDAEGRDMAIGPVWSVEGGIGDIDVNGLFTATKPGSGSVMASAGGFTGRMTVTVATGSLKSLSIIPDTLFLTPGKQYSLTAVGYSAYENVVQLPGVQWSVEGDAVIIEVNDKSCLVTAVKSGNSRISVSIGDLAGFANIFVSSSSISLADNTLHNTSEVPYYLEIVPDLVKVTASSEQQFTVRAVNAMGKERDLGNLTWSVSGGIGAIDGTGLLKAGDKTGSGRVIVTDGNALGTASVSVLALSPKAQELVIIPSQVSLASGTVQELNAFAKTEDGELIPVLPAWRAIGGIGSIDAAGRFTASNVGSGEIEATAGGLSARCKVAVSAGRPASIGIQPDSLSIKAGEQQKFSIICKDEAGNTVNLSPTYRIAGNLGTIDLNGVFTAKRVGTGSVIVAVSSGLITAKADIEVLSGSLAEIKVTPTNQAASAGSSVRFSAVSKDAYGNQLPVNPKWEIQGSTSIGQISSNGLFMADKVGQGLINAKASGITGTASVSVSPAAPAFIKIEPALLSISSQTAETKQFLFTFLDLRGNAVKQTTGAELLWAVEGEIGSIDPKTGLFVNKTNLDEPRTGYVTATAVINAGSELERTIRGRAAVVLHPTEKPLATITITPNPAVVIRGNSQKFSAVGKNTDGIEMEFQPGWKVFSEDGSKEIPNAISADGVLSVTSEMAVGSNWKVVASAVNSAGKKIQGEARLSLISGPLQSIELVYNNIDTIESGQMLEIEAVGYDQFRNKVQISPNWRITGDVGMISPVAGSSQKAVLTAGKAGSGEIIAAAEGKEGKAHITVTPGPLVNISISTNPPPSDQAVGKDKANPLVIKAGSEVRFTAVGSDSDKDAAGRPKPVNTIDVSPKWSVKPSDTSVNIGSTLSDGRFTGRQTGAGEIKAEVGSVAGSFYIEVVAGSLVSIRVSPSTVSVVSEEGSRQQFSASGYDQYGNQIAQLTPTWRVIGNIGVIDGKGLFTPVSLPPGSSDISGTVVASSGTPSIQGSASVNVVSALGKLYSIKVTVDPPTIQAGGQAVCIISGADEKGNATVIPDSADLSVSVPSNLGTVTPSDRSDEWDFRADRNLSPDPDQRSGLVTVTAEVDGVEIFANAMITLIPGPLSGVTVEPAQVDLRAGEKQQFIASGYDSYGNQRELLTPEWAVSPKLGSVAKDNADPQEAVFTGETAGAGNLIVRSQGYEGRANLTILAGELKTLAIDPEGITIAAGSSQSFSAIGKDSYGNRIEDLKLHWKITSNLSIGSVDENGLFSAIKTGQGMLKAQYIGNAIVDSNEASVTVIPGAVASVEVAVFREGQQVLETPLALLSGVRYDLNVLATDLLGNPVSDPEAISWSLVGDIGSIALSADNSAVFTARFPGRGQIAATVNEISASAEVEVVPHSYDVNSRDGASISGPLGSSADIPPGALRSDEKISIALAPSPGPATGAQRIGNVYSFEPAGMIFAKPVEITLSYSSAITSEIDIGKLGIYSWDKFGKKWLRVGGVVDEYQKSVTAGVNYLSLFAVMQSENVNDSGALDVLDIRLSPNTYFAPEINRLNINYRIINNSQGTVSVTIEIYDIRGHLVKQLMEKSPKYTGWNTDQWDGTDKSGEIVKNGRYFLLITIEANGNKVARTKHLAVFR